MATKLDTLNENQREAVSWNDGPLLVLAGPGSGKTRVLTLRLARLLEENESTSVLALTFTNKAATEMRARVDQFLGQRSERVRVCTFHSFAVDLLRQHGSHLGLRPDFILLTRDEDRIAILEEVIRNLSEEDTLLQMDRKNLLSFIDRLFAESYEGGTSTASQTAPPAWACRLFEDYCKALVADNRLDFGSLLYFARRLLAEKPGVARVLRLSWSHICVDEFQDTNGAQYDLLRLVAPTKQHNLFVVGDDDQIIFEWNGASPKRLYELRRDYDITVVQLPQSYRCPAPIIALANRLIAHNSGRIPGRTPITSCINSGLDESVVRCGAFISPVDEADFVPRDIEERRLKSADCVVLGRSARLIDGVAAALDRAGYEAYVGRRKSEFESPSFCVLMEALRLANARHDRIILRRLCQAWRSLTGMLLEPDAVAAAAALVGGDFLRAWADAATIGVSEHAVDLVARIQSDLVDSLAFPSVVNWFFEEGWRSGNGGGDVNLLKEELNTWKMLHTDVSREYGGNLTLHSYLQEMDLSSKTPPPGPDSVSCLTVHGAKGLEFKHVYLVGMAQEVFPSFQALRKNAQGNTLEEERRNCFVAITRVEKTLTITWSQKYFGYPKQPSQFLREMGIDTSAFGT